MNNENDFPFECQGDPWIETNLMNLIELLVLPTTIHHIDNIEQLVNCYNRVIQSVLSLNSYSVNNLEKLRSFASLARCIMALFPIKEAKIVFENACSLGGFNATFTSCHDIHGFIDYLINIFPQNESLTDDVVLYRHRALLKLEMEFFKNWLPENIEQYPEILTLLSQPENDLWQYSAKILSFIDQEEVHLLSTIVLNNGHIEEIDQFKILDECLNKNSDNAYKIERLLVNYIHMQLILHANKCGTPEEILANNYKQFEENVQLLQHQQSNHSSTSIGLIAWIKFYVELYAVALNNQYNEQFINKIDEFLIRHDSSFSSTLKLFVIKQICELSNINLDQLREIFTNRNVVWIRTILDKPHDQQMNDIRHSLILPTPFVVFHDDFQRISNTLTNRPNLDCLRQLIGDCKTNQTLSYCFLVWFIHYYSCFYTTHTKPTDEKWIHLFKLDVSQLLQISFDRIGHKLLVSLCQNFTETSYFRLQPNMKIIEVHQRLVVLNIVAYLISLKSLNYITYIGSLLFDSNCQMFKDCSQHLQSSVCLPGLLPADPAIKQMLDVKARVKERLERGEIYADAKFVYRCSKDCSWTFYFEGCGRPASQSKCPLCKKDIGAATYNKLIVREPPQIAMPIAVGFQFIDDHMKKYNEKNQFGYYSITKVEESSIGEKPEHLNRSISFRFLHMFTHAILLFLHDVEFVTNSSKMPNREYFQKHFEKDYDLIGEQCEGIENCHAWLFSLIDHMVDKTFLLKGVLNQNQEVIKFEKFIEERLIFAHIDSIPTKINDYKRSFAEYVQKQNDKFRLEYFVDELFENETKYSLLKFFNVTNIYKTDPIEKFLTKLQSIPNSEKIYPITTFLMQRLSTYENIQHLYPIVKFTNFLIHKFNHRLKRNDAATTTIEYYLTNEPDCETTRKLYESFLDAWYELNLKEVRLDCQTVQIKHLHSKENFAKNTMIAVVLLSESNDATSILLAACLKTIGQLQNEVVNYFHNTIGTDPLGTRRKEYVVAVQSVRPEHLFEIDARKISQQLVTDCLMINYEYGKSRDIIYDYDEIELVLRNKISSLPIIDTDKLQYLNYQFELYAVNTSLITDVRRRVKQETIESNERKKLQGLLKGMDNDDIVNYLGSLDCVFTYLRDTSIDSDMEIPTIQTFVEKNIRWQSYLNENVRQKRPFSTIRLTYLIDLYELLEECVFDQVLRKYVKHAWCEDAFSVAERTQLIEKFIAATFGHKNIAISLANIDCWIGILKRMMVRVLSNVNVDTEVPLQCYLERKDLWTDHITDADINTFDLDEAIQLCHTFVILKGLEAKQNPPEVDNQQFLDIQKKEFKSAESSTSKVTSWMNSQGKNVNTQVKVIQPSGSKAKKRIT
ncbi:unnamed protein product [Adineta ricciae]|uniref:Uncharacterized protein n=1 Tax=Adineta ricciae TaxID=249248 RepID=A0A814MMX0_ADIRI|nr:unnamed protein product [Adineta ricciae]CAF1167850.1 unnamed protein product [Adineta ricciae]